MLSELETGDILLFSDTTFIFSRMIEYFTGTPFSHVGMVLKNPKIDGIAEGLYIFESTGLSDIAEVEEGKCMNGVQIRPLEKVVNEYNGRVWWRRVRCTRNDEFYEKISEIHSSIHHARYDLDPLDWLRALIGSEMGDVHKTKEMFCSALVGYVLTKLEFIHNHDDWTIIRPCDYSSTFAFPRIKFNQEKCSIDDDVLLKK
jgi:hypothetical protein